MQKSMKVPPISTPIRQVIEHHDYNVAHPVPTAERPSKSKIARINKRGLCAAGWACRRRRRSRAAPDPVRCDGFAQLLAQQIVVAGDGPPPPPPHGGRP